MPRTSPAALAALRPGKQRVAWFMSMSKPDDAVSNTYVAFAKAATASARLNAPSLAPSSSGAGASARARPPNGTRARRYFIYTYLPHQDVDEPDDALCAFLRASGTYVLKWRLSFYDDIPEKIRKSRQGHINVGAFGRLDVPLIASTILRKDFEARGLDMDYVLYTDTDVLFARDWPARDGAGKGCEIPNFKGSYLGRFPLVSADFWTSDRLSERSRSLYFFSGRARARAKHSR